LNTKRQNTILVVDDDRSIRTTLAAILEQDGYDVDTAENGAQAIQKSNSKVFDLALVDMRLPDMMGTELLSRMKERTPKMAKIMVTGYPSMQNAISAVNQGADGYVLKPVDAEILLDSIRKHLEKRDEAAHYSEKKVAEFIETRAQELGMKRRDTNTTP
jgi:DNA-binding NtrC family response regulator